MTKHFLTILIIILIPSALVAQTETDSISKKPSVVKRLWKKITAPRPEPTPYIYKEDASQVKISKKDINELISRMSGVFNSEAQAARDTNYYNIRLIMKPMWRNRKDGKWLYVEQATARKLDKPYRQRIYHVFRQDKYTIVSQVYELPDPTVAVGAWKNYAPLPNLTPEQLSQKEGCAIYLHKNKNGNFFGSTPGKECLSNLKGATYTISEVTIMEDKVIAWDRGFDAADKQIWGAENGGYIFVKNQR